MNHLIVFKKGLGNVLQLYGVDGRLLSGMKSFYVNSITCVGVQVGGVSGMCDVTVAVESLYGWCGKK